MIEQLARAEANIAGAVPVQYPDIADSSVFGKLSAKLSELGCRSAIALPLHQNGKVYGAINLFSDHAGAIDGTALALLIELADDLAFGIQHLRAEAAQRITERERLLQAERLSQALEQTSRQSP